MKTKNISKNKNIKKSVPEGVWEKCSNCEEVIYTKFLNENNRICNKCGYHFKISAEARINILTDQGSFNELFSNLTSKDPLNFQDIKTYKERIKEARKKTGKNSAIITGIGKINGIKIGLGVMDFEFLAGSMDSVVGEKITRLIDICLDLKTPLIIVSTSGGARMQESIFSLMQMAKTSAAIAKLSEAKIPYISILTDPTTGGVSASFAMLGDVNISEPGALIAFAGPRVIEQTIRQKLPEGFQKAEFLLKHGMIDMIVHRNQMKETIYNIVKLLQKK